MMQPLQTPDAAASDSRQWTAQMSFLYLLYKQYIHAYKSSVKQTAHSSNYKQASVQELLF